MVISNGCRSSLSRKKKLTSPTMSRTNGTNGEAAGSPVSSNQNGTNGTRNGSMSAPDKPERKINAKEAISKHRNWFSNFEKSKSPSIGSSTPGPENVDSARRTSVNKENKPSYVAAGGGGGLSAGKATPHTTTPLSPNHASRSNRSSADSIETYMQVRLASNPVSTHYWT